MKTALLVYGQLREYDKCIDSIKKHLLDVLHPDVFVNVWDKRGHSLYSEEAKININFTNEIIDKSDVIKHFNPIECHLESYDDWLNSLQNEYKTVMATEKKSATPKNYKIKLCNIMKRKYEELNGFKYDCVIVFRPDTILFTPIPDYVLNDLDCVWQLNPPHIFNPNICHSMFHVMNSRVSDVYESYYDALPELWKLPYIEPGFDTKFDCTRTSTLHFRRNGIRIRAYKRYMGFVETYRQPIDFNNNVSEIEDFNENVIDRFIYLSNNMNEEILSELRQQDRNKIINILKWCVHYLYLTPEDGEKILKKL